MLACTLNTSSGSSTARAAVPSAARTRALSSAAMSLPALLGRRADQHQRSLRARGGAGADRAGRAVLALDAVAGAQAVEAVPLHHAREPLALGPPGDVDDLPGLERLGGDLLAERVLASVGGAQLDEVPPRRHVRLGVVAGDRLVHLARVDRAERELDRAVTVLVRGADLGDHTRAGLHHGDRDNPVVVPHLGHAELRAQDALDLPVH